MKLKILFAVIIIFFSSCAEEKQKVEEEVRQDDYRISYKEDKFTEHDRYSVPNNQIEYEFYWNGSNYYPIGWSRDGKIAFRKYTSFDGIGGCLDEIIVQSMITDKTLKTIKLDEFSPEYSDDWDNHCDLDKTWRNERRTVLKYLNRYEIEDNSFGIINTSDRIRTDDREFRIKLSQSLLEEYSDETGRENKTKYKLKVYFDGDSKTISNEMISAHNVDYLGFYTSPFEDRVVIVLQYQDISYGEYSHNGGIITVGCHLHPKYWD